MALTVQDNTGLSDADSYVSVAAFKTYCLNRGLDIAGMTDGIIEEKLRLATDYMDAKWRYKGTRLESSQSTEFPRDGLTDWTGVTITGITKRVKDACCDLAFAAYSDGTLFQNLDRGGRIKSETVGPLSVTYADDAPAGKCYESAERKLAPYMRDKSLPGTPYFGTDDTADDDAIFEIGMHDASTVVSEEPS